MTAPDGKPAPVKHAKERKVSWAVRLGRPLLTLLGWTWRIEEVNAEAWRSLVKSGKPYILSSWHGQLLVHIWAYRFRNLSAMVSEHGDGEIGEHDVLLVAGVAGPMVRPSAARTLVPQPIRQSARKFFVACCASLDA